MNIKIQPKYSFLIILMINCVSCFSQEKEDSADKMISEITNFNKIETQIGDYIVTILEDSKGNLWFGTLGQGVAKFDGNTLRFFTKKDGLKGNAVTSVLEDKDGNLWFGTSMGLSKYDGASFTNFLEKDGLIHNRISNMLIDSKGKFWIGTWGGVCVFDGANFTDFPLPNPNVEALNDDTKYWITEIMEDSKGNIWFGRDGYGACKYNGKAFEHITKEEGICSNNVQTIEEDSSGNIWIGTRVAEKDNVDKNKRFGKGGLTKYNEKEVTHYPDISGLHENDVYAVYEDAWGILWVSTINSGVYEYNGKVFKNYKVGEIHNKSKAIMSILKDKKGNVWLGCAGGLFRLNLKGIVNVTRNGPWN